MIFHFPNLLFGHPLDTLFVATIRAFVTARVAMISRSTSSRTLYLYHVSNLKFLSKAQLKKLQPRVWRIICVIMIWMNVSSLLIRNTTFPRVLNDILKSIDTKKSVVLLLLDLSAAFDTVNHKILLHRLRSRFVVNKFKSKLKTSLFKRVYEVSSVFILHFCNYVRI